MFEWFKNLFRTKPRPILSPTPSWHATTKSYVDGPAVQIQIGGRVMRPEEIRRIMNEENERKSRQKPTPSPSRNVPGYDPSGDSYNAFYSTNVASFGDFTGYSSSSCSDSGSSSSSSDSGSSSGGSDC